MNVRAGRVALLLVVVLHLVADTALSPFYPQLFERLFGITDPAATGGYVWACRVAAVAALPLWGLAARRWPLHRLVVTGLVASAGIDAVLGFAPSYTAFLALSVALVGTTMSLALAYPAFMALGDAQDRAHSVSLFTAVTYAATVVSTLLGAAVMALPDVRWGIASFALLDLALAYHCHRTLSRPAAARTGPDQVTTVTEAGPLAPAVEGQQARWWALRAVAGIAVIVFVAELGRSVVRPFYTEYVARGGEAPFTAALLFLLPSLIALAVLPTAARAQRALGRALLPATFLLGSVGLGLQALTPQLGVLVAGGVLFGAALGLGQIALDLRMFGAIGTRGPAFTAVETVRATALMISPLIATAAVGPGLAGPLVLGALLLAGLGVALTLEKRAKGGRIPEIPAAEKAIASPAHPLEEDRRAVVTIG